MDSDSAYSLRKQLYVKALAGLLAVIIAALTAGFHALKSALENPVKNLRGK